MPRRNRPPKRTVTPDPVYNSDAVAKFVNIVMHDGKRAVAERVMYDAMRRAGRQARKEPIEVFDQALRNVTPLLEVKPRRVGGATYQVPIDASRLPGAGWSALRDRGAVAACPRSSPASWSTLLTTPVAPSSARKKP